MNKDLRNKLGSYEPPYNPQHWEQLSQRLAHAQQRNHWYYAAAAALALFILVGIGVFFYEPTSSVSKNELKNTNDTIAKIELVTPQINEKIINKIDEKVTEQAKLITESSKNNGNKISKNSLKIENKSQNSEVVAKSNTNNNKETLKIIKSNKVSNKGLKNKNKIQKVANQNDNKIAQNKNTQNKMSRVGEEQVGISENSNSENTNLVTTNKINENLINLVNHGITGFKTLRFPAIDSSAITDTAKFQMAYYKANANKIASNKTKFPLRVGAVVMPMLARWTEKPAATSTATAMTAKNGQQTEGFMVNVGLLAEWKINRFSLGSGVVFSNYTLATPQEKGLDFAIDTTYQLNLFLSSQQNIQELLIPISLRYDLRTVEKGKWFVTANLFNSYLLSEQFSQTTVANYFNTTINLLGYNNKTSYSESRETQHTLQFFSAFQIQAGYERLVTKHFSYQLEPFFRLSLQSQNNNSQFYAAGVSLRVNYN